MAKASKYKLFKWYLRKYWRKAKEISKNIFQWICDIPKNVYQFYLDNFETYLTICQCNEHVYIGKKLWYAIKDGMKPEDMSDIRIWFKKYPILLDNGKTEYQYMMFINPDLSVYDQEVFTAPLQFNVFGHIGFQAVQPTPAEIVYEYGLKCDFEDRIMLRATPFVCNGEKAFIITKKIIGTPKPLHKHTEDVELDEIITQ